MSRIPQPDECPVCRGSGVESTGGGSWAVCSCQPDPDDPQGRTYAETAPPRYLRPDKLGPGGWSYDG